MVFLPLCVLGIDLSDRGLTEVPTNVAPNETKLDIGMNEITRINKNAFFDLTLLTDLIISHNKISAIERGAFYGLSVLQGLYLDNNQLSSTPDMSNLSSLRTLALGNNPINWLAPKRIGKLTQLTRLYLRGCDLRETLSLPRLNRLIHLSFYRNEIKALSKDIFAGYQSIRELTFSHNKLSSLPDLGSVSQTIKTLWLRHNRFYHIPKLGKFVKLKKLSLSDNYISTVPMDILIPTTATVALDNNPVGCAADLCWTTSRDLLFALALTCPNGKLLAETAPGLLCEGNISLDIEIQFQIDDILRLTRFLGQSLLGCCH